MPRRVDARREGGDGIVAAESRDAPGPWKDRESGQGSVEQGGAGAGGLWRRRFLRPALLGESIASFRCCRPGRRSCRGKRVAECCSMPRLRPGRGTGISRAGWRRRRARGTSTAGDVGPLVEQYDYFGQLSAQVPAGARARRLHQGRQEPCLCGCPRACRSDRSQALLGCGGVGGGALSLWDPEQRGRAEAG